MMIDEELPMVEFTAHDRCDGCPAQAYVLAEHDDMESELLFCAHHIKRSRQSLLDTGWRLRYDTEALRDLYDPSPVNVGD